MIEDSAEIRYLLHRMNPDEREEFARRVIEDEEVFDRVREAETELYDAYARDALPRGVAAEFVRELLQTPAQRTRLRGAQVLARRSRPVRLSPIAWVALAAGVLLGLAVMPRLLRQSAGEANVLRIKIDQTRASASVPEFRLTDGPVEIRVPWNPAEPGKAIRIELRRDGAKVWTGSAAGGGTELKFRLEAGVLRAGLYEMAVESTGGEPIGFAEFRVTPPVSRP
jgi:hypothetical protein